MIVSKSFVFETNLPAYQREAIQWLDNYKGTRALQDVLRRYRFSPEEIQAFRKAWPAWFELKEKCRSRMSREIH